MGIANTGDSTTATNAVDLSLGTTYTVVARLVTGSSTVASTLWATDDTTHFNETSPSVTATDAATALPVVSYAFRQPTSGANNPSPRRRRLP